MTYKVNNIIYAAGPDLLNTLQIQVTLAETVDPEILRSALGKASQRFPYFCARLTRRGEEYWMESNDLPFVVLPYGKSPELGTPECNYHLFSFQYEGRRLYINTVHYITDGNGIFPFIKSLLYYYLSELHPEEPFDPNQFPLAGDPVPQEEADDSPYPEALLPEDPLGSLSRPEKILKLDDQPQGYESMPGWTSFMFMIKQKALMSYVSSVDGSPATFVTSLIFKAIADSCPEKHLPQVCGMQHQFRHALGRPKSHMCHVNIVPMVYPDDLRNSDIEKLNTMGRGMLIIRADDSNDVLTVNEHIRNEKLIKDMTLEEKRAHMRKVVLDGIGDNTFEVSYTGRVDWNGLERYIENVSPYLDMTLSGGLSAEIFSVGDYFSINLMQRSGVCVYAERFEALLKENGIAYEAEAPEHFEVCGFRLPE